MRSDYDVTVTAKEFEGILRSYRSVIAAAWTDDDIIDRELSFWPDANHEGMYMYLGREYSHNNIPPDTLIYFKFVDVDGMKRDVLEIGRLIKGFKEQ